MSWFPFHYRDIKAFSDDNLPLSTTSNEAAKLFDSAITQLALHDNDPGMHIFSLEIKVLDFYLNTFRNVIYYFRGINLKIWSYFLIRRRKNCKVFFGEVKLFDLAYQTFFVFGQLKIVRCTYLPVNWAKISHKIV